MISRTEHVYVNAKIGVISKCVSLLMNFIARTIFLRYLGATYLGINGLYTEILQILNFAELGIGEALIFAMYSPVASGDEKKMLQLLDVYKKAYRIIAFIVLVLGIAIIPFLHLIIKGADIVSIGQLRGYFFLYLANSVITYFVADKLSYINALQLKYVSTKIDLLTNLVTIVFQTLSIILLKNYVVYLCIQTAVLLISKITASTYLKKKYPILNNKPGTPLCGVDRKNLIHEIKGLAVHKFSSVAVHATDNIIISSFTKMGVVLVGYISNYNLLINSVLGFVVILFSSTTASFGNIVAASSKDRYRKIFFEANFINFWVYGFCSIAFFILIPPFIIIWIGEKYLVDQMSFLLLVINCYLQGQSLIYNYARDASGHFGIDKGWALTQAIVNLAVSLLCVTRYGLIGVYIGTVVSRVVYIIGKPISTYRFLFDKPVLEYYIKLLGYMAAVIVAGVVSHFIAQKFFVSGSILSFIKMGLVVLIIPNVIFWAFFRGCDEFSAMWNRVVGLTRRK